MTNTDIAKARQQSRKLAELFQRRAELFEGLAQVDAEIQELLSPPPPSPPAITVPGKRGRPRKKQQ